MVARLIQFLYNHAYDVHYIETSGSDIDLHCSLKNILHGQKKEDPKSFTEDRDKDQNQHELRIHLKMCEMACSFDLPALVDHALHRPFHHNQRERLATEEMPKAAATITGIHNIRMNEKLRKLFANFIVENQERYQ